MTIQQRRQFHLSPAQHALQPKPAPGESSPVLGVYPLNPLEHQVPVCAQAVHDA
jgi:hypothetical protein